ncbi:InlB B-repeat-containing protein [Candidatus Saccharibacteria bacterium]|nr:InlB B-repeat-containing protein [Candidatus Saccharibacteria bacterium]
MSTLAVLVGLFSFAISCPASSIAKQSTLTIEVSNGTLSLDLLPSAGGSFGKSSDATIAVSTDNFTGYTLSIASSSSTSLINGEDEIESISTAISENTFTNGSTYNNKWGYKPSQYVTTSGGINTTVSNTNFLPAPSLGGDLLAVTSTANSTDDEYTLSFGAKVDASLPAGTYSYTYVLTAVANTIVYNITYDDSTSETVTDMPSPNPVALEIDGGTPTVDSYVTLSSNVPIMTSGNPIMSFGGWCSIPTTYNSVTENYDCSGTSYAAGADYPVDQTSSATNITLYAIWLSDPFPKVWSQTGKCIFNNGTISGSECQNYVNDHFIDTGIALYSNDNYQKDYEVHFTLDAFNPGGQSESQATIFNDKLSSSVTGSPYGGKSPGIVVRITSNKTVEIKSTYGAPTTNDGSKAIIKTPYATAYNGTDVRIFRIDGIIYTSIDNGPLEQIHDFTPFSQQFGLSAWFGAYPDNVNCTENCTAAKRYITGEMSNMYIKLGDMPTDRLHTITYDANGGTPAATTYLVLDGDALSEFPTVTRSGWSFDGWWTASSTGQQISTATVPTATTTYYAHWYKSVTDAQITNTNIALSIGDTETINITNAADIEPYTLVSSNPTVATVNSAGVITAVSNGAATITLTGSKTGDTRTISVAVGTLIYVDFDSQGGSPSTYQEPVANGGSFSSLPEPVKTGYELEGWYTGTNGAGNKLTTSTVFDTNTPTQYYAYWTQMNYVCKAATVQHEETCNRTSSGCRAAGYAQNARILYGSMIQPGATSLAAGNALTCDIDNNQTFDETNERFYYLTTVGNNAALLYYKNISNDENIYDDALALLPDSSTTGWTNPNLVTYDSLLMNGDYEGKNARFMSYDETVATCNNSTSGFGTDGKCLYILEQSNFAYTNIRDGYWIGKANHSTRVHTSSRNITDNSQRNGVRPVIEVPLDMIDITVQPATYTITFNPHNESSSWDETIDAGDDLSDVYPATDPTYTNHIFQGWYTDASVGTQITSSTVPSGSTTYHAQWKGTVALATVASNSISMTTNDTATVTVTNAADLEGFTFSSSDTSVATIDASTGVITPLTAGTTNISIMGTTSNTTNQIVTVTVTAPVPTTYTVYFNPHNGSAVSSVTVNIGSPIGSNNIPSDPTPSGVDEVFMGWFTAASGGTAVDGTTTPSVDGETYHAQYKKIVCKLETSSANLHVHDTNVAYGQIANSTTPQAGDAYNCDVDYDDTYSAVNERFYYVGQDENNNAVLVAWNSYYNGAWAAGTGSDSIFDYTNALGQLPANTSGAWDNPGLIEQDTGKAARFTTRAEVAHACGDINVTTKGSLVACDYFMEHSAYDSGGRSALWLMIDSGTLYRIHSGSSNLHVTSAQSTSNSMVRPTIVVPYKLIEKYVAPAVNYSVTFDPQNGDSSSTITVTSGNSIAADMPQDPTYTNHVFVRWYDISNNNTVTSATQPSSTMIVYAEWKLDVTQATISNADLTLAAGDQLTLLVGNSSQLESYTFSSANTATATVDASTGVITGVAAGIVNIIMTGTQSNLTKTIEVQVTAAQVVKRNVTFNANGGTTPSPAASFQVDDGTAVGSLPTTSRTNYRFFGWYTDDGTFYNEVTPATTVDADATYYARWVEDTSNFPIVFSEINECEFNGNAVISGTYCTQDKTKKFIDSGIALFSTTNYQKDFEIGFTITDLTLPQPVSQGTLVNSKYENSGMNYPGFVFRSVSGSGSDFELTAKFSNGNPTTFTTAGSTLKRVKIVRENQIIKYSINDGTLTTWHDVSGNTHRFDTNVWFGAAAQSNGTSPQRYLTGKLTDMYVKLKPLSTPTEYLINFDPGSGSFTDPTDSSRTVTVNNPLGSLPIPNPPSNNHTFVGWFDESTSPATQVTASTVPDSNKTYVAHYSYQSSNTPVTFNVSNNATRGYQSLIDGWVQSPINITTFNEASPINNSTWGVTSELSELQFWEGIRSNFVNNNCLIPSYGDAVKPLNALSAWTNGSVDCSKPDAYDTNVDAPLTVYLYDLTNSTLGTQVDYAKASEGVIHNMIPGQTYYWEKSDDSTVHGYVTATSNKGTRWVDTGTIRNVRDLGGLPVAYTDGNNQSVTGTLKYGRLFRGEKLGTAAATELTNLGITTEYNVGDEYSSDTHLSDYHYNQVIHYDFDYNTGDENNSSSNYMKAWTAVTNIMTDIANTNTTKNVYFHCRVGADRTGTVAYLLEGLLGVPDEMRYEEYALTNVSGLYDRTRYYKQKSSSNNLKFVYMMGFVETTQDIYNWYMHNPNADVNLIQAFRTAMVDRN